MAVANYCLQSVLMPLINGSVEIKGISVKLEAAHIRSIGS